MAFLVGSPFPNPFRKSRYTAKEVFCRNFQPVGRDPAPPAATPAPIGTIPRIQGDFPGSGLPRSQASGCILIGKGSRRPRFFGASATREVPSIW